MAKAKPCSARTNVTTDGTCNASFQAMLNLVLPQGSVVTATATDAAGNTSEFSACRASVVPPAVPVAASSRARRTAARVTLI